REDLIDEVVALVRSTVAAMPPGVGVSHHVAAQGWRDPCLLEHLARGCFDEVVLVAAPRRRRDRRPAAAAAAAGGVGLLLRGPGAATAAPGGHDGRAGAQLSSGVPEQNAVLELSGGERLSYATLGAPEGPLVVVLDGPGSRGLARAAGPVAARLGIRLAAPD